MKQQSYSTINHALIDYAEIKQTNKPNTMKKILIFLLLCGYGYNLQGQQQKSDALLKELSDNACKCIDSIDTRNKTKDQVAKEVSNCIDKQAGAYQLGSKLMDIDLKKKGQKKVDISINNDTNSDEYKKYYYEIERYLMSNCKEVKNIISSNDIEGNHSVSKKQAALDLYSQGLTEYKKENYKDAIVYFEKALKIDSDFTFAWDNLGICYRKSNDIDKAIYAYQKSLELDSNGLMPLQNIAVAYRYKNEFDKAIEAYQKLATLNKNDPEVYYGLGETYALYLKDYEKGLDNMCKAYTLYTAQKSPYRTDAEKIIGSIYSEMKRQNKLPRFNEILKENHISPVE